MEKTGPIVIKWLFDEREDCGCAYGCKVVWDGKTLLDMTPKSDPFNPKDYTPEEVIHELLKKLGYKVISTHSFTHSGTTATTITLNDSFKNH